MNTLVYFCEVARPALKLARDTRKIFPNGWVGNHPDLSASRCRSSIRRDEGGTGAVVELTVIDIVVLDAVAQLMCAKDVGGFGGVLVIHAAVGFEETNASGHGIWCHRGVDDTPLIDRRRFGETAQGTRERPFEQPVAAKHSVVTHRLIVAAIVDGAERRGIVDEQG